MTTDLSLPLRRDGKTLFCSDPQWNADGWTEIVSVESYDVGVRYPTSHRTDRGHPTNRPRTPVGVLLFHLPLGTPNVFWQRVAVALIRSHVTFEKHLHSRMHQSFSPKNVTTGATPWLSCNFLSNHCSGSILYQIEQQYSRWEILSCVSVPGFAGFNFMLLGTKEHHSQGKKPFWEEERQGENATRSHLIRDVFSYC